MADEFAYCVKLMDELFVAKGLMWDGAREGHLYYLQEIVWELEEAEKMQWETEADKVAVEGELETMKTQRDVMEDGPDKDATEAEIEAK